MNCFGSVMVSVFDSSAVVVGSSTGRVKPKTIKLVFVASPLSRQHYGERTNNGWLGIRIMCPSGAILIVISLKINLFSPWYSWKIAELALNNNHSLTHSLNPACHSVTQPHTKSHMKRSYIYINYTGNLCSKADTKASNIHNYRMLVSYI
jgi:hypothetical protein